MDDRKYDMLKLENQLCFPLYACSKEIIRRYKPHLDPLDLTYTQYITLMVLWEKSNISVKELGDMLYLDSGTMTPVLKKLEAKGYITRNRSIEDERCVCVALTDAGMQLRDRALHIPQTLGASVNLSSEEVHQLYGLLYKLLNNLN